MSRIALWICLLQGLTAVAVAQCHDASVQVIEERRGDTVRFIATSDNLLDFTITFNLTLENMEASRPLPVTAEVRDGKRVELLTIRPQDARKPTHYVRDYSWRYGTPNGAPSRVAYLLPYSPEERHKLIQGYLGDFTHHAGSQNEYAYDFAMPVGTTICAARTGVIVGVRQDSNLGGRSPAFANCGNYVIIRHDDGTYAEYFHLKQNGVLVALGATVKAGQPIALSGATGFTSTPHLHFAVFRVLDGYRRETLPVFMRTKDGLRARLGEGQTY